MVVNACGYHEDHGGCDFVGDCGSDVALRVAILRHEAVLLLHVLENVDGDDFESGLADGAVRAIQGDVCNLQGTCRDEWVEPWPRPLRGQAAEG